MSNTSPNITNASPNITESRNVTPLELLKTSALTICAVGATITALFSASAHYVLTLSGAGIGFGLGVSVVARSPKEPNRREREWLKRQAELQERERQIAELEAKRIQDAEAQAIQQEAWLREQQEAIEHYAETLRNEAKSWAEAELQKRIAPVVTDHNQKVSILQQQYEQLQRWEERLRQTENQIKTIVPATTQEWESKFREQQEEYERYVAECEAWRAQTVREKESYKRLLDQLYSKAYGEKLIELHQLKQPILPPADLYDSHPRVAMIAERTLRFIHEKLGKDDLTCDFLGAVEDKGGVAVYIKPKKFPNLYVETLQALGKILPALQTFCPGCNAPPGLVVVAGGIRIDWDTSGDSAQTRTARTRMQQVVEPAENWLEDVVANCFHFRVNGQSGSGKSTFVNNLIGLMRRMYGDALRIVLIDPKYPMSRWSIRPQYRGLEQAILGLKAMADEVLERLRLATEDADAGRPIRKFDPVLYVLDEVDMVASEYNEPTPIVADYLQSLELATKKAAAYLLKQGLKVGRALKVMVAYIGQSPLCSALGMNRNDFNHSANFFLGENIPSAIDEVALKHQQGFLMAQYKLRIARYMESKGTDDAKLFKYFALVKIPGEAPYLAPMPPEGYYDWVFFEKDKNGNRIPDDSDVIPAKDEVEQETKGVTSTITEPTSEPKHRPWESLDPNNADDMREIQRRLEERIQGVLAADIVTDASPTTETFSESLLDSGAVETDDSECDDSEGKDQFLVWSETASPNELFEVAKERILEAIGKGETKPYEIVKAIWGEGVVDPNRKPYRGKGGVKEQIEMAIRKHGR